MYHVYFDIRLPLGRLSICLLLREKILNERGIIEINGCDKDNLLTAKSTTLQVVSLSWRPFWGLSDTEALSLPLIIFFSFS